MPDGFGGMFSAFMAAKDAGRGRGSSGPYDDDDDEGNPGGGQPQGGGGGCGPPYTESYDHEFEPDSGTWPGGVDASHYCKHCGVVGSMHGQGAGADPYGQGGGAADPYDYGGADPYSR